MTEPDRSSDLFADILAEVVTRKPAITPPDHATRPSTMADIQAAIDRIANEPYQRDRYVIPRARWERILEGQSEQVRRDLGSLVENGTVILSDHLPDPDTAYRFRPPARWGDFIRPTF